MPSFLANLVRSACESAAMSFKLVLFSTESGTPGKMDAGTSAGQRADLMHCNTVIISRQLDRYPISVSTSILACTIRIDWSSALVWSPT